MIQEQALNYILSSKDASFITLNNLNEEFFSDYTREFNFIKKHYEDYGNICDKTTFLNAFQGFEIIEVHESPKYLLEQLFKDKNKRFLAKTFNTIRSLVLSSNEDDQERAMQLLREAAAQSSASISMEAVDIISDTSRYEKYLEKANNAGRYFIPTGFPELDEIMGGGWDVQEELGCIVARTGKGKSWILNKGVTAASQAGFRVGVYSGEMSVEKVGYRFDTLNSHISNGAMMFGGGSIRNEYKQYIESLAESGMGPVYILTPQMLNGPATVSALRAFIEKYNLDILFVDQHSLLADERKGKSPVEKAANISTDLKLLQVVKCIPIICACQQNRSEAGEGKAFDTTQLAQSDKIGQDATLVLFIERKDDLMKLHIGKARNGGEDKVLTYRIDLNRGSFEYIPSEQDVQKQAANNANTFQNNSGTMYSDDEVF